MSRSLLVLLALTIVTVCHSLQCDEDADKKCVEIAYCDTDVVPDLGCFCPEGYIGNGCADLPGVACGGTPGCLGESWAARATFDVTGSQIVPDANMKITWDTDTNRLNTKADWGYHLFGSSPTDIHALSSIDHQLSAVTVRDSNGNKVQRLYLSINMLYPSPTLAQAGASVFNDRSSNSSSYADLIQPYVYGGTLVGGFPARVYRWQAQTTSTPIPIDATGMAVDFVVWKPDCKDTGCWVIDVTYTSGKPDESFNTFYLPKVQDNNQDADWQEDFSYDVDWTQQLDATGKARVWNTQFPNKFPCGSNVDTAWWSYDITGASGTDAVPEDGYLTSCCIPNFVANYRVVEGFETYFQTACPGGETADVIDSKFLEAAKYPKNVDFPVEELFLDGAFSGINAHVEYLGPADIYIQQHKARVFIDELELRRKAGFLTGTVGVEYTVDTFIGIANFKPTSNWVLDSAAAQVAIHLEKTNFFSVSTHGTNDYTFLEYVNLRLVTVYKEDVAFGGETEDGVDPMKAFETDFYRTSNAESADYVQVTFTMGGQYSPNLNGGVFEGGLIPLDSVLAGKGTFAADAEMEHKCVRYMDDASNFWLPPGSEYVPPVVRRAQKPDTKEAGAGRSGRHLLQDGNAIAEQNQTTFGPLDSCHEQSRCMYMEFNKVEDQQCNGDCEWEVCLVFDAGHNEGCKVYEDCKPITTDEIVCVNQFFDGSGFPTRECPSEFNYDCSETWGQCGTDIRSWCNCENKKIYPCGEGVTDPKAGPGDYLEDSYFGNLFMWCDQTTEACPADFNFPDPDFEYFKPIPKYNISQGDRQCQRGGPGQKLFFVMRDGTECRLPQKGDTPSAYLVTEAQKEMWGQMGFEFPADSYAKCEPRFQLNDECPSCESGQPAFMNNDGTNPCGCVTVTTLGSSQEESGFDTCTENGVHVAQGEDGIWNYKAECVWTVKVPDSCCECGVDKETGKCENCNGQGGGLCPNLFPQVPGADPGFQCCGTFNERLCQGCAPGAQMCASPVSVPDNFVSFNVPLGVDWFPEASATLNQNVFVSMVINALDSSGCANPNSGCSPKQVKTTLSASIPVVKGGLNIFCDGVRAKTDLKDVADADMVVGTAASSEELSRLKILRNIASTSLDPFDDQVNIDSDSIEAGFLTLILKGNSSFFTLPGTLKYGLELEDVITIHIMEPDSTKFDAVQALLLIAGDDNVDSNTNDLNSEGYNLNGAFRFEIDRMENRAFLEPTAALMALCPFNPTSPTNDVPFPSTCVSRRDVRHRGFPNRIGATSTAMEVVPLKDVASQTCATTADGSGLCDTGCTVEQNARFMELVLGENTYAGALGRNYSCVIAKEGELDGRYRRAFWINPAYEWTPSQTGGASKFSVSQKIIFFALVNLNEHFGTPSVPAGDAPTLSRRRFLLSNTEKTGAGIGRGIVQFDVSQRTILAQSFEVDVELVSHWEVTMTLSADEACQTPEKRQQLIRAQLAEYVDKHASDYQAVLVTSMQVDIPDGFCGGRRSIPRRRLVQTPTAIVQMMIVFKANPQIDAKSFQTEERILEMEAIEPGQVAVNPDEEIVKNADEGGGKSNMPLIAGCAAGGGVGLILLAAGVFMWTKRAPAATAEVASAMPDLASLKNQLEEESA